MEKTIYCVSKLEKMMAHTLHAFFLVLSQSLGVVIQTTYPFIYSTYQLHQDQDHQDKAKLKN